MVRSIVKRAQCVRMPGIPGSRTPRARHIGPCMNPSATGATGAVLFRDASVLDGSGVDLLESFLKQQCTKGGIVIIASHHVSRVLNHCNRAVILSHGRLTFDEAKQRPWPSFDTAFSEFLPHGDS